MSTTQTILGCWNVVEQQRRAPGEWAKEHDFGPGEWVMSFFPNGRMNVVFQPAESPGGLRAGSWALNPASGVIVFDLDEAPAVYDLLTGESASGMVFDAVSDGIWLYFFEDTPGIRPTRDDIVAHHAHRRIKLEPGYLIPRRLSSAV